MNSRLSSDAIQQIAALRGRVARVIGGGWQLNDGELRTLLLGTEVEYEAMVLQELKLWSRLLKALREQPLPELRLATVEALMLRNLPEASVLLAVDMVTSGIPKPPISPYTPVQQLRVNPANLDFGILAPGQSATGEIDIQGGTGRVLVESDQLRVMPLQFGHGTTCVRVEAKPLRGGLLWTAIKLVTSGETLEVPVRAQWTDTSISIRAASSVPTPTSITGTLAIDQSTEDLVKMIEGAMGISPAPNRGGNPPPQAQRQVGLSADTETLEQLRRLLG